MAVDPIGTLSIIRAFPSNVDPAIDADASDLESYRTTRDPKHLKLLPETKPTVFRVQRMKAAFHVEVIEPLSHHTRHLLAFLAACHEIELPDGEIKRATKSKQGVYGQKVADTEWADTVRNMFGINTLYEIGRVAYDFAGLPDGADGPFVSPAG